MAKVRFLRTGDLGFLNEGALYVTGRLKDLIIIRGKNHYPQDIELTVERSHEALQPGNGAVFSIDLDGEERLVVVHEVKRIFRNPDVEAIARIVRQAVAEIHEIQIYALVLIRIMSLPKTSSGKIQRQLCKKKYLAGEFMIIGESGYDSGQPALPANRPEADSAGEASAEVDHFIITTLRVVTRTEDRQRIILVYLKKKVAALLKIKEAQLAEDQPITSFGLDSLLAIDLVHRIEIVFGVVIPMAQVLEGISLAELTLQIVQQSNQNGPEAHREDPSNKRKSQTIRPVAKVFSGNSLSFIQRSTSSLVSSPNR